MANFYPGKQSDGGCMLIAPAINPGDTIVLKASDNPRSYFYISELHGTAANPITIVNEGGPVIVSFSLEHCTYVKIIGTSSNGYGFASGTLGIQGRSANIEATNIDIDGGDFGIWLKNEANCDPTLQYPNWFIDHIDIHHCRIRNIRYEGIYGGSTDPNALWLDRNAIVCNGVPATQGQYKPTRMGNIHIHHNIFDKTGRAAIQLSGAELGMSEIDNNIITNSGLEISDGQGNGINIGLYSKVYVHDNDIDYTYVWGIASLGGTDVRIENNRINHSGLLPASATRDGLTHSLAWPWAIIVSTRNTIPVQNTSFVIKNNLIGSKGSAQSYDIEVDDNYGNYPNFNRNNVIYGNTLMSGGPAVISVTNGITYSTSSTGVLKVGTGEYMVLYIDNSGSLYACGNNIGIRGTNNTGVAGIPSLCVQEFGPMPKFYKAYGGLHDGAAIDVNGNVWHVGENGTSGMAGIGNTNTQLYTTKISVDNLGNTFSGIIDLASFFTNSSGGWVAVKSDGTVWIWGKCTEGFQGDGTDGSVQLRPIQVPMPSGKKAIQVVAGYQIIVRCTDGTVWAWGGGGCDDYQHAFGSVCSGTSWKTPQQVSGVTGAIGIAGGRNWNWAWSSNKVWYWGLRDYAGIGSSGTPWGVAQDITSSFPLALPLKDVVTNSAGTHIIDANGALWGSGNTAEGEIGDGTTSNMAAQNYFWNFTALVVNEWRRVVPTRNDFVKIYGASPYTYYSYFETADGQLYFCGRNKSGVAGNGEVSGDWVYGGIDSSYPNSWDKPTAVPVDPFSLLGNIFKPSPYCVLNPTGSPCNNYVIPPNLPPTVNAGNDVSITGNKASLSGSGSAASGRNISKYTWSQISGPSNAYMLGICSKDLVVKNLLNGIYTFRLTVTDNLASESYDDVNVLVNVVSTTTTTTTTTLPVTTTTTTTTTTRPVTTTTSSTTTTTTNANVAPTVDAGVDKVVILPINSVVLNGVAVDDGYISSYLWTRVSGSTSSIIVNPTQSTTTINNLVWGTYQFKLTAVDNKGVSSSDLVNVIVRKSIKTISNNYSTKKLTITFSDNSTKTISTTIVKSISWDQWSPIDDVSHSLVIVYNDGTSEIYSIPVV